jgi:hypothetical protein
MRNQKEYHVSQEISVMPSVTGTLRRFSRAVSLRHQAMKRRMTEDTTQDVDEVICAVPPGRDVRRALCVWACILFQSLALSGCALYKAYEKCGFRGCPGDANITADVVLQLSRCSFIEPNVVSVQTIDHVVYLNGVVRSSLEIGTAESIAGHVPGVARVVNSIVAFTR